MACHHYVLLMNFYFVLHRQKNFYELYYTAIGSLPDMRYASARESTGLQDGT